MTQWAQRYGPWALVTGASSGIGAEFARQLAARGLNLVLVARRLARLEALASELTAAHGVAVRPLALDLSTPDFMAALEAACADVTVGLVVSNAGYSITAPLVESDAGAQVDLLHVNARAPLLLGMGFGRKMRDQRRGGLIFVSSIAAFSAAPGWANYAAAKSYNLLLAEALARELRPFGVDVQALCPGTTATEFLDQAVIDRPFLPMTADVVVRHALAQLGRRTTVIPGWRNRLLVWGTRLVPRRLASVVAGLIVSTMTRRGTAAGRDSGVHEQAVR